MLDNNGKVMMTAENEREIKEENEIRVAESFKQANEDSWGGSIP
jgi:hypothetical protein